MKRFTLTPVAMASLLLGSAAMQQAMAQPAPAAAAGAAKPEAVLIVGQRASRNEAVRAKRDADQVIESIVSDDVGKFPDNTVAEALQRVPGVQTVVGFNNEIVNPLIRGIGGIVTTVDGREMFTGVGRGFSFQDLPAEVIARANVYKSAGANLIEGGVAGAIDLRLRKPLEFAQGTTFVLNGRASQGDLVDKPGTKLGLLASHRGRLAGGEFGALLDLSYADHSFNRPISFNCDPRSGSNGPAGAAGIVLPTCVGGLTDSGDYQRPQVSAALQWKPDAHNEFYVDALYAGYRSKFGTYFIFSDVFAASSISNARAGTDCFDARVDGAGFLGGPTASLQRLCNGISATFNNVPGLTSTQAKTQATDQSLLALGWRYSAGNLALNLDLSRMDSRNRNRNIIVDIGKTVAAVDVRVDAGGYGTTSMPGNPLGDATDFRFANSLYQDINRATSTLDALALNGSYDLGGALSSVDFGLRMADRSSAFRSFTGGPGSPGGNRVTQVSSATQLPGDFLVRSPYCIPQINGCNAWMTPNADYLRNNTDALRQLYGAAAGDPAFNPLSNFDATERTYALYVQPRFETQVAGMRLDGVFGGRFVRSDRDLSGTGQINGALTPLKASTSTSKFLPNASAKLALMPNLLLRASAGVTMSRPALGDLNPALTYSVPSNANIRPNGSGGNAELKDPSSTAYDLSLERYFGRGNYLQAAVYHRVLKNRVARSSAPEVIGGIEYDINRPRNLGQATLQGLELSGQYFLDFLPGAMGGLGLFGNYTLADSRVDTASDALYGKPLLGVSKHSFNLGLMYEMFGFTSRLTYTWRDKFNEGPFTCLLASQAEDGRSVASCGSGNAPTYNRVKAYGRVDFSLGYKISESLNVAFNANNLTGAKYYSYFQNESFPHDIRSDDKFYGVSFNAKF
ncbi:TonB-dependent receptor [Aquabacterium sp. OR-4]|uniref:TonB-dependent receptor n=1 Tax=Aquabacterium sp. OR-4 TaxID=2978127 RepID=UPI0028C8C48A|nr:TonB-dependent receptor [Aquabacterium sp. OR-4]MDT7838013.1 TonB-dependent receptor [Aquabacterium sp. OR-4]